MITPAQLERFPLTARALGHVQQSYPLYTKTRDYILRTFDDDWLAFSEELLSGIPRQHGTPNFDQQLRSFIRYSHEFVTLQIKLNKAGRYLHESYDEMITAVYENDLMKEYYLDGLFLSQIFWPNHYKMIRFFQQRLAAIPADKTLEVPCGTGIYSYLTLQFKPGTQLLSVDLSPHAVEYTRRVLRDSPRGVDAQVRCQDVFQLEEENEFDLIICGELLEHLNHPEELLRKLKQLLKSDGRIFLTTAIFAAALDHIYLFESAEEVRDMLLKEFVIEHELVLPTSLEEHKPLMKRVPMNYACVLAR